ncbi:MAG: FAD-dependent thymidylate synthase [Lachnospiraceae bacterium]|nr:FAD-dependent thymidylate synthase [Lachnospiraceae bacterium]
MGTITILPETTKNPITLMGVRAGVCWGSDITDDEKNYKRGMGCIKSDHGRVMEYVNVEMILDGYSARVIREWYTHIGSLPSRLQASTRYIDYSKNGFGYVTPKSIEENEEAKAKWDGLMEHIRAELCSLENEYDIPKEDVANGLPLGMTTKIVDRRNLRNLVDMSHQRKCYRAYWEYRELFADIECALRVYSEEWAWITDNLFVPKCRLLGRCPESKPCGKISFGQ